jgi:pimeloyl-ACP methyl ester carboxylesterase
MKMQTLELEAGGRTFSALACGEGPPVLCVHGFPDHMYSFRHQLPALAEAGYRAVAPMLRGYEPATQRRGVVPAHHPVAVCDDVIEQARSLAGGEPIHLVGHDWGGIIGFLAIQREPSLFRSYCSVAVSDMHTFEIGIRRYPSQLRKSWYMFFFQLRGLADAMVASRDYAFIEKLWRDWSPGWEWEPEEMARLKQTFAQPGVLWSALAYYRATLNPFLAPSKRMREMTNEPIHVPSLLVTGETDGCMDTRIFDCIDDASFTKGHRVERIPGAGHFAHQERPELFNELLLGWLNSVAD